MVMSLENIIIERANLTHVDGILKLAEDNTAERGGELTGALVRDAVVATIQMLPSVVAHSAGHIVGFLLTWETTFSEHPCVRAMLRIYPGSPGAYVYGPVCVESSARGQGLAGSMFKHLGELLPGREGILFIKASNEPSLRAHRKMGMRKTAEFTYEGAKFFVFAYNAL